MTSPQAPAALLAPLSSLASQRPLAPAPGCPAAPSPQTQTLVLERGSSLTSADGPSGGRVDTHGWEAGRGEFALTLPVLGPIWGEREGMRVAQT